MRTLFALGTGIVLGTVAALWIAARGDVGASADYAATPVPLEPSGSSQAMLESKEAPE